MQYTVKAKDIKDLQRWGKENAVIAKLMKAKSEFQPDIFPTNAYWPSGANWAWQIGIPKIGANYYELLTRFGSVEGGRQIYMPRYTVTGKRAK